MDDHDRAVEHGPVLVGAVIAVVLLLLLVGGALTLFAWRQAGAARDRAVLAERRAVEAVARQLEQQQRLAEDTIGFIRAALAAADPAAGGEVTVRDVLAHAEREAEDPALDEAVRAALRRAVASARAGLERR